MSSRMPSSLNPTPRTLEAIRAVLAERSLADFIRLAWPTIEPGTDYASNWHIDLLSEYLEAVEAGQITRLLVNVPPRSTKSLMISVCYPAWAWIQHPEMRFIKSSYSDYLSRKHNILTRMLIKSPWYQQRWGDRFRIVDDIDRQYVFENDHRGMQFSTSVGGTLTGEGGDRIIVDDPQNPKQADSEVERERAIEYMKTVVPTRLNEQTKGVIIVVMQRLHEWDVSGYLLEQEGTYEHVCLPAFAEEKQVIRFPMSGKEFAREKGDLLDPVRYPEQVLQQLKKDMSSEVFSAQFQQRPAPAEGLIFKREWLGNYYRELPEGLEIITSWDLPFEGTATSAECACVVWGRKDANVYLLDLVHEHMEFTRTVEVFKLMAQKYPKAAAHVIENKGNGAALLSALRPQYPGLIPYNPTVGKEARARSITPMYEAGNVLLPDPAVFKRPWLDSFVEQHLSFPKGKYKDIVDAANQGLLYYRDRPQIQIIRF